MCRKLVLQFQRSSRQTVRHNCLREKSHITQSYVAYAGASTNSESCDAVKACSAVVLSTLVQCLNNRTFQKDSVSVAYKIKTFRLALATHSAAIIYSTKHPQTDNSNTQSTMGSGRVATGVPTAW